MSAFGAKPLCLLVAVLLEATPEILRRYAAELTAIDSPLMQDELSRRQCEAHARRIVEDVVAAAEGRDEPVGELDLGLALEIGATRAASGAHPRDSLRAAAVLIDTMLAVVGERLGPGSHDTYTWFTRSLNQIMMTRLREAAIGYVGLLLGRIQQAHTEERQLMTRELHDRLGYHLSVALRHLELHDMYRDTAPAMAADRLDVAREAVRDTIVAVRDLIADVRRSEPDGGLQEALADFLRSAGGDQVEALVRIDGDESWASPEVRQEAFLIIREALRNALVHSHAPTIVALVEVTPDELRARVMDDGNGFTVQPDTFRGGAGLSSMRQRAGLIDGSLVLASRPGQGTMVELMIPLRRKERND